jgi:hypothetical protein
MVMMNNFDCSNENYFYIFQLEYNIILFLYFYPSHPNILLFFYCFCIFFVNFVPLCRKMMDRFYLSCFVLVGR